MLKTENQIAALLRVPLVVQHQIQRVKVHQTNLNNPNGTSTGW